MRRDQNWAYSDTASMALADYAVDKQYKCHL